MSFAIIQTGGKQYKVKAGEIVKIEKFGDQKPNSIIELNNQNLLISSKSGLGFFNKEHQKFKWFTPNSPH